MAKDNQPTREQSNEPPAEEFDFPTGFYRTPTGIAYVPRHIGVGEEGEVELYEKDSGVSRVTLVPYLPVDKDKISALSLDARFDPRTLEEMLKSEAMPEGLKSFLMSRLAQSQPSCTGPPEGYKKPDPNYLSIDSEPDKGPGSGRAMMG